MELDMKTCPPQCYTVQACVTLNKTNIFLASNLCKSFIDQKDQIDQKREKWIIFVCEKCKNKFMAIRVSPQYGR
jgi:hypothetical protein